MSKSLHARLVAYEPFGQRIGVLPQPTSFDASLVHNDDGALNLTYSRKALGGSILSRTLEQGLEIALEVSDGGKYREPDNARYLVIARKNDSTDESDTVTISSAPSISWLLSKTLNNDTSHLIADGDNKGKRAFLSRNSGVIVKTMMDENRERGGAATGLTLGFDTGMDSAGTSWKSVYTLYYSLGVSVQSALASLVGGGGVDWRTSGRTLKMWNPDSTSLSRDLSGRVNLRFRRDVAEAPNEESISELASDILVEGDNGLIFRETNAAAPTPWGKWESYVSQGGVSDKATAQAFMLATLESSARVRGQYTRSLNIYDVDTLPLFDYHAGDWITAPTVKHGEKVRIQEIDISFDSTSGLTASVMLNDLKLDAAVKANKKIQGITGGATLAGSEGGRPAPEKDHRTPKAPTGLVAQTDAYISSRGTALGLATLQWAAVSQATDDTAIDISGYRVEYRKSTAGAPWVSGGVTDAQRLTLGIGGLECGQRYEFRVRAVPTYSDRLGDWSNVVVALVASDVTPPSIPSKPILTSKLGVVDVQWDGRNNAGGGMELDFDHVEVGISDSNGNWKYRDSVARDGHCVVTGLEYRAYWFALRSVDHSGNKSDWGVGASITVASAVSQTDLDRLDKDLRDNKTAIDNANRELSQAKQDIAGNTTAIGNANRELATAKSDLTQAKQDIANNTTAIGNANKQITSNKTAIDNANRELDAAQGDIAQAKKDITQAKSDAANAKNEAGKASAAIESAKSDIANAASKAQSALDKANSVGKSLDGLHNVYEGPDDPTTLSGVTVRQGDFWYKTQKYWTRWSGAANDSTSLLADFYTGWEGEPNNSASWLVPLSSHFIGVYVFDGSRWNERNIVAANILASGSVVASNMAANSITTEKLVAGAITTDKVAANAIVAGKIASGAITTDKLAALAVTADKLAANSVVAGKLAANSVDAGNIVAGAVTVDKLAANSVDASKIVAGAISTDKLAALAVTADKLAANSVVAGKIAANAVNAGNIVSGAITTEKLAALSVTVDKLAANSVNASKIVSQSITGDEIASNTIVARNIAAQSITSDKVAAGQFVGYVFTGSIFQSSTADNTGWKLKGNALDMWDSKRNHTVHLDGEGANNLLTGTFQTGTSGNRVMISPSFRQFEIDGTDELEGAGIQFCHGTDAYAHPYIAAESTTRQEGEVSALTFNGGHRVRNDPGAFGRIGERKDDAGRKYGTVLLDANQDYDSPDTGKRRAYLSLLSSKAGDTTATLVARDPNGRVGIQADIDSGYLYMGGFLGGFSDGRATFQATWWEGQSIASMKYAQYTLTSSNPAKYGSYKAFATVDHRQDDPGLFVTTVSDCTASGWSIWVYTPPERVVTGVDAKWNRNLSTGVVSDLSISTQSAYLFRGSKPYQLHSIGFLRK
ncbi:fibronectin type III domain-containing protein [Bifidobacterium longum]|uniref:fibronectin type III domain-containing protein n=1 Tax=Bifidobacterium longum TaxID=216816 RepID=UPI001F287CE9|nr:fibronectin type III domain-containing protein [Bifidobacterium longum]UUY27648.1 fibronectin type III domain-containing protein [Bifidobacterium longum subsp. infantis]